MKYVYVLNNTVQEIIPEINPAFPEIPIEDRYTAEFLTRCVEVFDDTPVEQNWTYSEGVFSPPPEPEPEDEDTADEKSAGTEEQV